MNQNRKDYETNNWALKIAIEKMTSRELLAEFHEANYLSFKGNEYLNQIYLKQEQKLLKNEQ